MTQATIVYAVFCMAGNVHAALSPAEQTAAINAVRPANAMNDPSIQSTVMEEQLSFVDGKQTGDRQAGIMQQQVEDLPDIIFEPATAADLRSNRAATLNGHKVDVLAFHIPQAGGYSLPGARDSLRAPFEGQIYADGQTHPVLRIKMKCTMIPESSGIRTFDLTRDYSAAQLAGREVILPSHYVLNYDGRYSAWRESDANQAIARNHAPANRFAVSSYNARGCPAGPDRADVSRGHGARAGKRGRTGQER